MKSSFEVMDAKALRFANAEEDYVEMKGANYVSSQYLGGDDDCRAVLLTAVRSDSKSDLHPPQFFEKMPNYVVFSISTIQPFVRADQRYAGH